MRRIVLTLVLGFSFVALSAFGESMTGYISDSKCGKAHMDGSEKSVKCVEGCVSHGAAPVFVSGDKIYKIDPASKDKVMSHLGHKVTIDGSVSGDTLTISDIQMGG
jgi:hypothetical protein